MSVPSPQKNLFSVTNLNFKFARSNGKQSKIESKYLPEKITTSSIQ